MNYQKHYNKLIDRAKNRILEGYSESHHIVPRCMGGLDEESNLVSLTPEEHYVAHQLLVKIYPNEHRLVYGLLLMTTDAFGNRVHNKLFGWHRRKLAKATSIRNIGNQYSKGVIKKYTPETLAIVVAGGKKLSEISKNHPNCIATRFKKGMIVSDERKEAQSILMKGKPNTLEQRQKMSLAAKALWAARRAAKVG